MAPSVWSKRDGTLPFTGRATRRSRGASVPHCPRNAAMLANLGGEPDCSRGRQLIRTIVSGTTALVPSRNWMLSVLAHPVLPDGIAELARNSRP